MNHYVENGIAYTVIHGVKGTLNYMDANILREEARKLGPGSRYLETGSYLGCSAHIIAEFSSATV